MCRYSHIPLLVSVLAAGLGGCAGPVETHIRSEGVGVAGVTPLMWAPEPEGRADTPMTGEMKDIVASALHKKGFRFVDSAPVMVMAGLAERPAAIAVEGEAGKAVSRGKRQRLFQNCRDRTMRLRISMTDSATGEVLYIGEAQEAHCHAQMRQVLPRLADRAVEDVTAPGRSRQTFSFARD